MGVTRRLWVKKKIIVGTNLLIKDADQINFIQGI